METLSRLSLLRMSLMPFNKTMNLCCSRTAIRPDVTASLHKRKERPGCRRANPQLARQKSHLCYRAPVNFPIEKECLPGLKPHARPLYRTGTGAHTHLHTIPFLRWSTVSCIFCCTWLCIVLRSTSNDGNPLKTGAGAAGGNHHGCRRVNLFQSHEITYIGPYWTICTRP